MSDDLCTLQSLQEYLMKTSSGNEARSVEFESSHGPALCSSRSDGDGDGISSERNVKGLDAR